jgi:hypothetical protein
MPMNRQFVLALTLIAPLFSNVLANDLGEYVGYTIVAKKTIVRYVDKDGNGKDSFEGCNYGRKIIFEDQTYLTCASYGYHYAYRPEALLLVRNGSWIMLVDDESFDMQK